MSGSTRNDSGSSSVLLSGSSDLMGESRFWSSDSAGKSESWLSQSVIAIGQQFSFASFL